jgi:hypothetical protein
MASVGLMPDEGAEAPPLSEAEAEAILEMVGPEVARELRAWT